MATARSGQAIVSRWGAGSGALRPKKERDVPPLTRSDFEVPLLRSDFDVLLRSDPDFGADFRRPAFATRVPNAVRTMRPSPNVTLPSGAARIPLNGLSMRVFGDRS
ncbi:hypothetical protein [Streptomyces sp. NPDC048508]|uniref:hypothetical protein n=1 Tax=Streptomyces sp. NPDC048508 TaxID=3365561 RepID=UPI00371DE458